MKKFTLVAAAALVPFLVGSGCPPPSPTTRVTVAVSVTGQGIVSPNGGQFIQGRNQTFRATAGSGWAFDRWEGDVISSTNPLTIRLTANINLTAVFRDLSAGLAPVANDITVTTTKDLPVTFNLQVTGGAGALTYSFPQLPSSGTLAQVGGATHTYSPTTGFVGGDPFTYQANDGTSTSNVANVNMVVAPQGLTGWARSAGSDQTDAAYAVAVSTTGAVYVAGRFAGTVDFDPGSGTDLRTANAGTNDVFLAKFAGTDGTFEWVKTFGGIGDDAALAVAPDPTGGVYVAGYFSATVDFGTGSTNDFRTAQSGTDVFVCRYASTGTQTWTETVEGTGNDRAYAVAVDSAGNVFVAGSFSDKITVNTGSSAVDTAGGLDAFVLKLAATNGSRQWAETFGGIDDDEVYAACTNSTSDIILAGGFSDTVDFDPGPGVISKTSQGDQDIFACEFNFNGDFQWVYTAGANLSDVALAVTCDSAGNVYLGGYFNTIVDFDPTAGTDQHTVAGGTDAFVAAVTSTGTYRWAFPLGGTGNDQVTALATDTATNLYVAGFFSQVVDFDPSLGSQTRTSNGNTDIFVARYSSATATLAWVDAFGGTGDDRAEGIDVSSVFHVLCAGQFEGTIDLNPSATDQQTHTAFGDSDIFLFKVRGTSGLW